MERTRALQNLRGKDRSPFVCGKAGNASAQAGREICSANGRATTNVPQTDFTINTARKKLPVAALLQLNLGDPAGVLFPKSDQACLWRIASIVDSDRAVSKAGDKDMTHVHLGRDGGHTARSASRDVLHKLHHQVSTRRGDDSCLELHSRRRKALDGRPKHG